VVIYALVQTEAGITELIYLIRVFTIVTNLVFNHPGRVYETAIFELYQSVERTTKGPYRVRERFWFSPIARVSRAM